MLRSVDEASESLATETGRGASDGKSRGRSAANGSSKQSMSPFRRARGRHERELEEARRIREEVQREDGLALSAVAEQLQQMSQAQVGLNWTERAEARAQMSLETADNNPDQTFGIADFVLPGMAPIDDLEEDCDELHSPRKTDHSVSRGWPWAWAGGFN